MWAFIDASYARIAEYMRSHESRHKRADRSVLSRLQLAENLWDPERQRSASRPKIIDNCGRKAEQVGSIVEPAWDRLARRRARGQRA